MKFNQNNFKFQTKKSNKTQKSIRINLILLRNNANASIRPDDVTRSGYVGNLSSSTECEVKKHTQNIKCELVGFN